MHTDQRGGVGGVGTDIRTCDLSSVCEWAYSLCFELEIAMELVEICCLHYQHCPS